VNADRLLVANRGEIARRIITTARNLGWETVAVHTPPDAAAPYVTEADYALPLQGAANYLDADALINAARRSAACAVHPGYGFLAESAAFARACENAGLVFVGPTAATIELMGDKGTARRLAADADVRCVPGVEGPFSSDDALRAAAAELGYPLMIKAVAGGGGRGLRRVDSLESMDAALAGARAEARSAFGDDRVILERLITPARHVEVQVLADAHGHCIHLGERDCSVQRRHQKLIEECPAPGLAPGLRRELGDAAVRIARACDYVGAGTVEFLVDTGGDFFFLEMNTRLQVEHPVTEQVTGLDLVALQLDIARGLPLALSQEEVSIVGHAIEARLYAEDPARGFLPRSGRVARWSPPAGKGLRVDSGIETGTGIPPDYDTLAVKIIAHGPDRDTARRRLAAGLSSGRLLGIANNKGLLLRVLASSDFRRGPVTTGWLDERVAALAKPGDPAAARAAVLILATRATARVGSVPAGWSNGPGLRVRIELSDEDDTPVGLKQTPVPGGIELEIRDPDATTRHVVTGVRMEHGAGGDAIAFVLDGAPRRVAFEASPGGWWLDDGMDVRWFSRSRMPRANSGDLSGQIRAPMDGEVTAVTVARGDAVEAGAPLLVLEAMKIEHRLLAPCSGRVTSVHAARGARVRVGSVLLDIDPDEVTHD
jgi:acetyl/propionyl-CoA carboxylase alpha subunit